MHTCSLSHACIHVHTHPHTHTGVHAWVGHRGRYNQLQFPDHWISHSMSRFHPSILALIMDWLWSWTLKHIHAYMCTHTRTHTGAHALVGSLGRCQQISVFLPMTTSLAIPCWDSIHQPWLWFWALLGKDVDTYFCTQRWLCRCPGIACEPILKRAHTHLVREHSVTIVWARWANVDWSWPKEWN